MKNVLKGISVLGISLIMVLGIGFNVAAYSGWLDDYSGYCKAKGIYTVDSFYSDDNYFCMKNTISSMGVGTSGLRMEARKQTALGYTNVVDYATRYYKETSLVNMYVNPGRYKIFFQAIGQDYAEVNFYGSVYDEA